MSEYQSYEFLAVDRPLDASDIAALRAISSRADITATRFAVDYSYSSLKANPAELLARYFDVHVYVANWGTRCLGLRLPTEVVGAEVFAAICAGEAVSVRQVGTHTILQLCSQSDDHEGWVDDHGWIRALAGVRAELMRGDPRLPYIAWLLSLDEEDGDVDALEPAVPPGLGSLSAALTSLVEFLRMDAHLIAAAAESSPVEQPAVADIGSWIAGLATAEKDALLLRSALGEPELVAATLMRRFRTESCKSQESLAPPRRTVGELWGRADELLAAQARRNAQAAEENRRKAEAAAIAIKSKRLDALAKRKTKVWGEVDVLVEGKNAKAYDEAVSILEDLRDLALRDGELAEFTRRIAEFCEAHRRKPSLIARLQKAAS